MATNPLAKAIIAFRCFRHFHLVKNKQSILIGQKQTVGIEIPDIHLFNKSLKMTHFTFACNCLSMVRCTVRYLQSYITT